MVTRAVAKLTHFVYLFSGVFKLEQKCPFECGKMHPLVKGRSYIYKYF